MSLAFEIIEDAMPMGVVSIYNSIIQGLPPSVPGQSGQVLSNIKNLKHFFHSLGDRLSERFNRKMYLRLDKSSYRTQPPTSYGALGLHQDHVALRDIYYRRFHRVSLDVILSGFPPEAFASKPEEEPCCTVWIPLCDIDDVTPTIEVSPKLPAKAFKNPTNEVGYAVIADKELFAGWPMVTISSLPAGWGVLMGPLTLHRTCVREWHTKTRTSLDLRFLPRPLRCYPWAL